MKHEHSARARIPLALACLGLAVADAAPAATPAPPARPAEFSREPAAPNMSDPKTSAPNAAAPNSAAPAGAVNGRQPVDVDVQSLKPYNLPPASRAKMRACGEEWRALKLAGQAIGWTWRTFAEKCLVK
jgi:hypothetical protein